MRKGMNQSQSDSANLGMSSYLSFSWGEKARMRAGFKNILHFKSNPGNPKVKPNFFILKSRTVQKVRCALRLCFNGMQLSLEAGERLGQRVPISFGGFPAGAETHGAHGLGRFETHRREYV